MTTAKVDFTGVRWGSVEWTMLVTLYFRAYESGSSASILDDRAAADAIDRIDYDFERMRKRLRPSANQFLVSLRAWRFDEWAKDFLARHPDAVVLHLGCGLDSRAFRLDLPAGVSWYDVDVPDVMALRRQIYSESDQYQMIASSITESAWLEGIPNDRPTLVVAEGVLPYLTEAEVRDLLQRMTDRFGEGGELLFDGLPRWAVRMSKIQHWGTRDASELERWNPRLRMLERDSVMAYGDKIPVRRYRRIYRFCNAIGFLRNFSRVFRFEF